MPTYQYACTECGHSFEQFQSFSDAALTECPACEGRLRKVFSAVGVVFKGSGFYRTDSRSDSRAGANGSGGSSGGSTKTDTSTKTDSSGSSSTSSSESSSGASSVSAAAAPAS